MNQQKDGVSIILEAVKQHKDNVLAYKELGDIRVGISGELLIFNYTPECTFTNRWNEVELVSRGLIVHWPTAKIVARPFPKFFNLDERPETKLETLPIYHPCEITNKLDGSLGIFYKHPTTKELHIATRGSLTGPQATWATEYLRRNHANLADFMSGVTLLFEIIYPENRIVLNYGQEQALYLIGSIDTDNGYESNYSDLQDIAKMFNLPVVQRVEGKTVEDLIPLVKTSTGIEGWVLRFPMTNLRVKIKTEEYLRIHRLVTNLTPARVHEVLSDCDDEVWRNFLISLPEEFRPEVLEMANTIITRVYHEENRLIKAFKNIKPLAAESRKTFALAAQQNYKPDMPYLFSLLDGKEIRPLLLKNLDLSTLFNQATPAKEVAA